MKERGAQSNVSPHGISHDEIILTSGGRGEHRLNEQGKFFCQECLIFHAVSCVDAVTVNDIGSYQHHIVILCKTFGVCITVGQSIIISAAVHQIDGLEFHPRNIRGQFFHICRIGHNPVAGFMDRKSVGRINDGDIHISSKYFAAVIDSHHAHGCSFPFLKSTN